jgi:hypothetical protein
LVAVKDIQNGAASAVRKASTSRSIALLEMAAGQPPKVKVFEHYGCQIIQFPTFGGAHSHRYIIGPIKEPDRRRPVVKWFMSIPVAMGEVGELAPTVKPIIGSHDVM